MHIVRQLLDEVHQHPEVVIRQSFDPINHHNDWSPGHTDGFLSKGGESSESVRVRCCIDASGQLSLRRQTHLLARLDQEVGSGITHSSANDVDYESVRGTQHVTHPSLCCPIDGAPDNGCPLHCSRLRRISGEAGTQ